MIENEGARFNEEIRAAMRSLRPGDEVYIDRIMIRMPGEEGLRELESISIVME
ncbi:MAG: hypothetical protein KDC54_18670 [Lewinella sp.]|nr:hypothetical protein [Lewinella sp.]